MGDVTQLQKAEDEDLPGIDLSIVQDLPNGRQIQLKTCFLRSTEKHELDRIMDSIFRACDRQRAFYELQDFKDSLVKHRKTLAQAVEDDNRLDAQYQETKAKRQVEGMTLETDFNTILVEGNEEHERSHRRGPYEPKGWRRDKLAAIQKQRDTIKAEQMKEDNERIVAKAQLQATIDRFEEEIRLIEGQIERREQLFG